MLMMGWIICKIAANGSDRLEGDTGAGSIRFPALPRKRDRTDVHGAL